MSDHWTRDANEYYAIDMRRSKVAAPPIVPDIKAVKAKESSNANYQSTSS